MTQPFMRAYTRLVIRNCHRRGVSAMGGMAAQIPIKGDPARNAAVLARVRDDKLREVQDGHDGTWVAHPGLVSTAIDVFNEHMKGPNQIHSGLQQGLTVSASDLLIPPSGSRTMEGLRHNVRVGVQYLEAWLRGSGCVPLYDLMEDAATAEISRAQVWQWVRHQAVLKNGVDVTPALVTRIIEEEISGLPDIDREGNQYSRAREIFTHLVLSEELVDFLTLPAYSFLTLSEVPSA